MINHNLKFSFRSPTFIMVTQIRNVVSNASGEMDAVSSAAPQRRSKDRHDDNSIRKVFHFKCNHCHGIFTKMELRSNKNTVQHRCLNKKGLTRKIGLTSSRCKIKHGILRCIEEVSGPSDNANEKPNVTTNLAEKIVQINAVKEHAIREESNDDLVLQKKVADKRSLSISVEPQHDQQYVPYLENGCSNNVCNISRSSAGEPPCPEMDKALP